MWRLGAGGEGDVLLPQLEAEVSYSNVTAGGMLKHGIHKELRYDLEG
jgi:hypothetical protein